MPLATVKGTSYTDQRVLPGTHIDYIIQSVAPAGSSAGLVGRTWGLSVTVPRSSATDVRGLRASAMDQASAATALAQTSVEHETFIPQKYISAPPVGCGPYNGSTYSFGGDDRDFVADDYRYRTKVSAIIYWNDGGNVSSFTYIGSTNVYKTATKELLETRTASLKDLSVKRLPASDSSSVDLLFNIQATNPFCTGVPNSIDAKFILTVTRSRNWSIISGSHKQMPNHELYIKDSYATQWVTAYRRRYANVICLINGACERASMVGLYGVY